MSKKKQTPPNQNPNSSKPPVQAPLAPAVELPSQNQFWQSLSPNFWLNKWLHCFLIFLASIVVYANTIGLQYAVDDSIVILRNEFTKKGLKGMKGIWSYDTFVGFFGKEQNLVAGGRYRPLSVATFALENELFGEVVYDTLIGAAPKDVQYTETTWRGQKAYSVLKKDKDGDINYKGNPAMSHFINILLYAWLCVIIYLVLLQLFSARAKGEEDERKAYFIAFVASVLYALHPLHTEAVANIKGRDEILVAIGSLLALHYTFKAYLQEEMAKKVLWIVLASFWFLVGIFSKENAITFIAIIPVAIVVFGRNSFEEDVKKAAMLALPSLFLSLFFWFGVRKPILGIAASLPPMPELMNDPFMKLVNGRYEPFTFAEKLNTCLYTWGMYLKLLVLPHPLTNDYYPKHIHMIQGGQMLMVLFSAVAHVGMAWYGIKALFKRQPIAFAIVFYAATFSVVSNLFFPIGTTMAERFMFLPSLGFSLACALGIYALGQRLQPHQYLTLLMGLILIGALYSVKTFTRNFVWFDDYTLFTTDIAYSPNSAKLNNAVAGVVQDYAATIQDADDPDQAEREKLYRDAKKHALKAIELHPTYNSAWLLLGNAHVFLGNILESKRNKPDEAIKEYNEAIKAYREVKRLRPDHPDVQRNLTVVYRDKGKLLGQKLGRVAEAVQTLEEGLKENDKDLELLRLAGVANGVAGNHSQALKHFEKGLSLKPDHVALLYNQAVAYRIMAQISAQQGNAAAMADNSRKADEIDAKWKAIDPNYNPAQAQDEAKITNTER